MTENTLSVIFTDHWQRVNKTTYISGLMIGNVLYKKNLMEEFSANVTVEKIYFSDHDVIRILI